MDNLRKCSTLKVNMESLRGAADIIKRSPRLVRKKINDALHKEKLTEDWIHNREQVELGVMFNVKVLGRKDTDVAEGKGRTEKVVEELVQKNKLNSKTEKLRKASVMIDCEKLVIRDLINHQLIDDIPVKRICFCTADPTYPKVFAFMVMKGEDTSAAYIFAFLTNKKAMADAIALTVAQAYTMSYEIEHEKTVAKQEEVEKSQQENAKNIYSDMNHGKTDGVDEIESKIENTTLVVPSISNSLTDDNSHLIDDEEDEFLMLAQSRKELDIGHIRREDAFNSNITDFLAVNNTLVDLERAKSTEDLFLTNLSPDGMSPQIRRPSPNGNLSPTVLSGRSSPMSPQQNNDDLIQF